MAFTSISSRISVVNTNVIIELTTEFSKLMPKVPKSGFKIWAQAPHRTKNESGPINKLTVSDERCYNSNQETQEHHHEIINS